MEVVLNTQDFDLRIHRPENNTHFINTLGMSSVSTLIVRNQKRGKLFLQVMHLILQLLFFARISPINMDKEHFPVTQVTITTNTLPCPFHVRNSTDESDKCERKQGHPKLIILYYLCLNRIYAEKAHVGTMALAKLASPIKIFDVSVL